MKKTSSVTEDHVIIIEALREMEEMDMVGGGQVLRDVLQEPNGAF